MPPHPPLLRSLLDTDLYKVEEQYPLARTDSLTAYKLTMQQAVLHHFPTTHATYKFTLRDKSAQFTKEAFDQFQQAVDRQSLVLSGRTSSRLRAGQTLRT
jgi:nicotinic acid phosphoribosyltransferase